MVLEEEMDFRQLEGLALDRRMESSYPVLGSYVDAAGRGGVVGADDGDGEMW